MSEKKKVRIPINFQLIDANELAGYLEALIEDVQKGLAEIAKTLEAMRKDKDLEKKFELLIKVIKEKK